jgi:hypothetical protein
MGALSAVSSSTPARVTVVTAPATADFRVMEAGLVTGPDNAVRALGLA